MEFNLFLPVSFWLIFSIAIGFVGTHKEVGGWLAFFLSLIASPLIGAAFVFCSPRIDVVKHRKEVVKNQQEIIDLLTKISGSAANSNTLPNNEK